MCKYTAVLGMTHVHRSASPSHHHLVGIDREVAAVKGRSFGGSTSTRGPALLVIVIVVALGMVIAGVGVSLFQVFFVEAGVVQ